MKSTQGALAFVLLLASVFAFGQRSASRAGGTSSLGIPEPSRGLSPVNPSMAVFISGKVALDDGGELAEPAAIQTICHGQRQTMTYTDRRGSFNFQMGDPSASGNADTSDASNSGMTMGGRGLQSHSWQDCEIQAVLAGFTSDPVELTSRMTALESSDVGRLVLHRLEHVEGTSISVTSILAPNAAKKALEKGREEEKKGKWEQAERSLEKAVQIYPKYAAAWSELGQVQMHQNERAAAKHSFEQSIAADAKYVNPYDGLSRLAFDANQWPEVLDATNKLLVLNPINFPHAYLFNGVANLHLGHLDEAEKMTRQGLRVDDAHQIPKMEYLLGMILLQKGDFPGATEHMTTYLHLATQPADIAEANKQLAAIARLSAKASAATVTDEK